MTIEADLFFVRRRGPDPLLESDSVGPNDSKKFIYSGLPKVLIICDQDGNGGGVFIKSQKNSKVRFYESEDDEEGRLIDPQKPIRIEKGQEIVVWSEKTRKELNIYIETDEEDELPIQPPTISANP
ncbi:MAG: hypothetical protein HYT08_04875 [Candidatus Levybacteria bacterium]|nr:hypothetical protein [Candidatus Levybacteria bacterium]